MISMWMKKDNKYQEVSKHMAFLPRDFEVPAVVETARFKMRSITIHDAFKDYDAVMSSREHLWARFGEVWGWPSEELTLEQNIIDLGWHQKEFQLRSSFDYVVVSLNDDRQLGCVYVDPPEEEGTDADVWYWARKSELESGLEGEMETFLLSWLVESWPFKVVAINGQIRDLSNA